MLKLHHTFLSYCHEDKEVVRALRHELAHNGIAIWWDDDILPGQDWDQEIKRAMRVAYAVVVCLSHNLGARERSGVYEELSDAIAILRTLPAGTVFLIPVRLCDCEVPRMKIDATRTLDSLQRVDLFPDSQRKTQLDKLVTMLREKAPVSSHNPSVGRDSKKIRVNINISIEFDSYDKRAQNTLRHGLADFLNINSDDVSIVAIEKGSVKVTVELPEKAARRLMLLRNETGLRLALEGQPISSIDVAGDFATKTGIAAQVAEYRVGMDGRWGLDTLGKFSQLYSQVYSLAYALSVDHPEGIGKRLERVFQSYPWRGGFSRLNFYRSVSNIVPMSQRPDIKSLQFASPGAMVLNLIPEVARQISVSTHRALDDESSAISTYRDIDKEMSAMGLKKSYMRVLLSDAVFPGPGIRDLSDSQLAFAQESLSNLARAINFSGAERLSELTGNRLAALKILMSYFRRIRDLGRLTSRNLVQL